MQHTTVLLQEAVDGLALKPSATVVDATFGSGGHARAIVEQLDETGTFIGIDADRTALDRSKLTAAKAHVELVNDNFGNLEQILRSLHIASVDAVIADLGWRMEQFAGSGKGFSFSHNEPLHMTFGDPEKYPFTAADIVNGWDEHVIADVLYGYAEERFARRIARAIVATRKLHPIATTTDLVDVILAALPGKARHRRIHPATKTFQALRIAVNDELGVLETFINTAFSHLHPGGRLAVITFHSIEDRVVKHAFREYAAAGLGLLTPKKPIVPTAAEVDANPRARSAKLRIISKQE